ncbi:hypothetical protein TDB9533_01204 [Thalassocella blandensis]|nr:hypothetical protein TDB9533_01204 [Thalassocella blandensis]
MIKNQNNSVKLDTNGFNILVCLLSKKEMPCEQVIGWVCEQNANHGVNEFVAKSSLAATVSKIL